MNLTTQRKAFTLIELLIVITIVGILSTLLFRTLGDMITANGRIQQEKIMTQELITIQTTINNLSEHYPMIDLIKYSTNGSISWDIGISWFTGTLYLKNHSWESIQIYNTGNYLATIVNNQETKITNPDKTSVSGIQFKILPTMYYTTGSISENLDLNHINAEGFWIFGNISYKKRLNDSKQTSSYTLQHFIHLQQ